VTEHDPPERVQLSPDPNVPPGALNDTRPDGVKGLPTEVVSYTSAVQVVVEFTGRVEGLQFTEMELVLCSTSNRVVPELAAWL
jgi:hypothetical protein